MADIESGIARVIEWIELHYRSKVDLSQLAEVSCFSKYHFSRIFSYATGLSPIEYLNRYRLIKSAELLLNTDKTVVEISASTGFSSLTSFNVAFKKLFSLTPSQVRRTKDRNFLKGYSNLLNAKSSEADHNPSHNTFLRRIWEMNIAIKELPAQPVAYVTSQGNILKNQAGWMAIGQWARDHHCMPPEQIFIGIAIDDPAQTEEDECRYMHCITLPEGFTKEASGNVNFEVLPGGLYAQYRFYDTTDKLAIAYQSIFMQWLPDSAYEFDDRPCFEYCMNDPFTDPERKARIELYIPIRKKPV